MAGLGLGIALTVRANLGLGPWDVLHQGIARRTGLGIGVTAIFVGIAVMALAYPLGARISVVTVVNVVLVGLVIDGTLILLPCVDLMVARVAMLMAGVVTGGLGTALYLVPRLGAGPRDGLMTVLAARGPSVRVARTAIELTALGLGMLLGGRVGPGTVVWAFLVGPLIQYGLGWLTPLVHGRDATTGAPF